MMKSLSLDFLPSLWLASAQAQSYPLVCGGGGLRLSFESNATGVAGPVLVGTFEAAGSANSAQPGRCSWVDRTVAANEPHRFCLRINPGDLLASRAQDVIRALATPGGAATISVYNNGAGCMLVTSVDSLAFGKSPARRAQVEDLSRLPVGILRVRQTVAAGRTAVQARPVFLDQLVR